MADACFSEPRLAEIYDALDDDRGDLELYEAIASELGAEAVLDVGCGTGALACKLAAAGFVVAGVDPAGASLAVAAAKPFAERVRWVLGEVEAYPGPEVDLITMTGNVAQVFISDSDWIRTLRACRSVLRRDGWLVFEARDPSCEAWHDWTPEKSFRRVLVPGVGQVEAWCEVTDVTQDCVSFRWTFVFDADGAVMTSDSTLRFRERDQITSTLAVAGFALEAVRDAPDRPGAEMVFLASRVGARRNRR
jgi:SAM-dependent methyltransferase